MGPSLFQGFSGIAWAAEQLRGRDEEDRNQDAGDHPRSPGHTPSGGRGASRFPGLIYADRPAAPSRCAWCYGDLAVAVALFAAARARGHDGWRRRSSGALGDSTGSGAVALVRRYAHGMSRTLEQIEDEVLRLPEESRVRLMERLLLSFQEQAGSKEEGIARTWVEEAEAKALLRRTWVAHQSG